MRYTLGQAARATGKGKSTIQRAILQGKLSADRNDDGSYSIDPAELSRLFPLVHLDSHETVKTERSETPTDDTLQIAVLEERVRNLEERLRDAETVRDRLMEQNERLTMLLTAPQPEPQQPVTQDQPRSWWQRLIGR